MKTCIATICSKSFLPGLQVLLKSFSFHNPHLAHLPVVVLYDPERDHFSGKEGCQYQNIIWYPVFLKRYKKINFENSEQVYKKAYFQYNSDKRATHLYSYYKYDIFGLPYDKVVFLDTDMLVLSDLTPLFENDYDFAAVQELREPRFNAGLMIIGKKYLQIDGLIESFIEQSQKGDTIEADQPILNKYFGNIVHYLPHDYNIFVNDYGYTGSWLSHAKILHYIDEKPWESKNPTFYWFNHLNKLWWECYER